MMLGVALNVGPLFVSFVNVMYVSPLHFVSFETHLCLYFNKRHAYHTLKLYLSVETIKCICWFNEHLRKYFVLI